MAHDKEFKEVGHSGGKITFIIVTDTDGTKKFQIRWEHQRIGPAALFAVYALQGTAVGGIELGGIGAPWNPRPHPNCVPVFIASDSEVMFGHRCYACVQYWRSDGSSTHCPYCLANGDKHMFLTAAQCRYIEQYCETLS